MMTPHQFVAKWKRANLSERSAYQQHFLDICELLSQPKPAEVDPDGSWYTFERGVQKIEGGRGWADVWMRDHFGWEYKKKRRDLSEAYQQLLRYRENLENPPLLVVSDLDRFEIHTNFTGTAKQVYSFKLDDIEQSANLDTLRKLFIDPESLRPGRTTAAVTEEIAGRFARLADGMRARGVPSSRAAHFLMKLMFCMFAEDIRLLNGNLFSRALKNSKMRSDRLSKLLESLFHTMAVGGFYGTDEVLRFNGGLFADADVVELTEREIEELIIVNEHDWASVEPSIFGTLFERTIDPEKERLIGTHYTSRGDIVALLEPVVMSPLRSEWAEVRSKCDDLWKRIQANGRQRHAESKPRKQHDRLLLDFVERLSHVSILDPACGSGNFLYVAINLLLDLQKTVIAYGADHGIGILPTVGPSQLAGIEINQYAQQLAQVVIWIGYLQWMHHNGFNPPRDPVLEPIENIRCMDAIVNSPASDTPWEPEWPTAEFIVGNPPFLGGKLLRAKMGDEYVDAMFRVWNGRVPREADLCCYWFEKARQQTERGKCRRVGLLATQGIRGGANRKILERIKKTGDIFFAESDRDWVLDGANVHVSMVGFDNGEEKTRVLDGRLVPRINPNLTSIADTTTARSLKENVGLCFMGDTKGGAFDITEATALEMLHAPNPHGRPNSDVILPWINGLDVTRRPRGMWIIDFGVNVPVEEASRYEEPFCHITQEVRSARELNKRDSYRDRWWIHMEARPTMRLKLRGLDGYVVTLSLGKHRIFVRVQQPTLPDHQLLAFARNDLFFFGVLHSRPHEVWALHQGTQLETRPRYTPTTCFESFPFPLPQTKQQEAIALAAQEIDQLRNRWLNPPEWTMTETLEFPGSLDGPWAMYVVDLDRRGIGTVQWPRVVPKDAECVKQLRKRTLTTLYNQQPAWLTLAHKKLDEAVFAAYGWDPGMSDEEILAALLLLNAERSGRREDSHRRCAESATVLSGVAWAFTSPPKASQRRMSGSDR
jgi:type II restriction/modification system DNA methylase subunit YeeA